MQDDYKPDETREQYVVRRYLENAYAKQIMRGWRPNTFVQHYNPRRILTLDGSYGNALSML